MEISPDQLVYVGIVASVVTQALRLLASRFGYTPGREIVTAVLFALSVPLAVAFFGLPEVSGSDPAELAQALVVAAAAVFGSSALIYNVLVKRVVREVE